MQLYSGAKKQRVRMSPDSKEGRPVTNHVTRQVTPTFWPLFPYL